MLFGSAVKLAGVEIYFLTLPLIPVGHAILPLAIAYSMLYHPVYDDEDGHPFWQKLGAVVLDVIVEKLVQCRFPNAFDATVAIPSALNERDEDPEVIVGRPRVVCSLSAETQYDDRCENECGALVALKQYLLLSASALLSAAFFVIAIPWTCIALCGGVYELVLLFVAGGHIAFFLVVLLETMASAAKLDIGADWRYEAMAALLLLIPHGRLLMQIFLD